MRRIVFAALAFLLLFAARRRAVDPPRMDVSAVEWLQASAAPFATTAARSGLDDLTVLSSIVGDARIVSLGEATHGSAEFFTMKHRVLEYLVERKGFTVFAIEANLPEADAVDDYVMHGKGSAAAALSGMYFWTWDTVEVLDMIEWMREYNLRRGEKPPVRFRGFDAQFAHGTVPLLEEYLRRVDPDRAAAFGSLYNCIRGYTPGDYADLPSATRNACAPKVLEAFTTFTARRDEYVARSSEAEYAKYLRYARVILQAEAIASNRGNRDAFMAENVAWLHDVAHPGEKLVLWAHNGHVATDHPLRMGSDLRLRFGSDMVVIGFAFDRGGFNSNGVTTGLGPQLIDWSPDEGWEVFFREAGQPRFILDLRRPWAPRAAQYVREPQRMWSIGAVWNPGPMGTRHRFAVSLADAYDVMIYIETVTPSKLNRFR